MTMLLTSTPFGATTFTVIGDGTSTSVSVDLLPQIQADKTIAHQVPTGIYNVADNHGSTLTATLSQSTVTVTWASALASGTVSQVSVYLTFNP
jgi:hypothetical protein